MAVQIQIRRGAASEWSSANPTLADGELGLETDTSRIKIGDGSTAWNSLGYQVGDITGVTAGTGLTGGGTSGAVTLGIDSTVVTLSGTQTLANKSLTSPVLTGTTTAEIVDLAAALLKADSKTISVVTPVLVDSFNSTAYRSAEYLLQLSQGANYAMTRLLIIHDGVDVAASEYGRVEVGIAIPFEVSASFSEGNLEVTFECSTANSTPVSLKFSRTLFDA